MQLHTDCNIISAANAFIGTNTLFAIALCQMGQKIVLSAEHSRYFIIKCNYNISTNLNKEKDDSNQCKKCNSRLLLEKSLFTICGRPFVPDKPNAMYWSSRIRPINVIST